MSRRQPDEAARQAIAKIEADAAAGPGPATRILTVAGDVADIDSLRTALAEIDRQLPPLAGVLHAAGVLADKWMAQMSTEEFRFVLPPKTVGTWNLHNATAHLPLDFLVLFSSASSVLGTGGQANYGVANAFLDGVTHQLNAAGRHTVAVNWGAFAGSGMAAELTQQMESVGVHMLPIDQTLPLIEPMIDSGTPRITVLRADWPRFGGLLRTMSGDLEFRLIDGQVGSAESDAGDASALGLIDELRPLPEDDQRDRLQSFFAKQLSDIMGIDSAEIDPQMTLTALGMDSLMAIELGNKMQSSLKMELPMSIYLQGPTIEKLANHVVGVLRGDQPKTIDESPGQQMADELIDENELQQASA